MTEPPAVRAVGLTKRFGHTTALDDLSMDVAPGEVLGYLGPNGAGKTTTIRLMLGLLRPSGGRCEIFGLDAHRQSVEAHRRLAYVAGEANLWPQLTGAETLHVLGQVHGSVDQAYRDALIDQFELDPTKRVRSYSKGNRQKVILIAALMSRADLLVLDEPTAGLDPLMERAFRDAVRHAKGRGQTVFLSSHIMSEVEALCDRVAILRNGKLVESGTLAELRHLSALSVDAVFAGPPPDLSRVPGVRHVEAAGHAVHFEVQGSIGPLIAELATTDVTALQSREPSLEELFITLYGDADAQRRSDADR
ncbi:MAG TPA: ABC transporter ATP-binding protein [Acidimicrobiales bacterium]|nr:ABC transporter ATP-binding protein [Acidimicrobiales bacterium]